MKYLVTGTGRSGTGYASKVLQSAGIGCGHETVFGPQGLEYAEKVAGRVDADSSWLAAPFLDLPVLEGVQIIHLTRHPKHVIESLLRIHLLDDRVEVHKPYRDFAYRHLPGLRKIEDAVLKCVYFYVHWNLMIEDRARLGGRVLARRQAEGPAEKLVEALGLPAQGLSLFDNRRYNARGGRRVDPVDITSLSDPDLGAALMVMCDRYGYEINNPPTVAPRVFWGVMMERSVAYGPVNHLLDIAMHAGMIGAMRISVPYQRVDAARNQMVEAFRAIATSPDDTLVMLDCDHRHPESIIERLAVRKMGVTAALAFRRSKPYEPMFFVRDSKGQLRSPGITKPVTYECDATGTAAVAIKRWVFDRLAEAGDHYFFRYEYRDCPFGWRSSEDMYFAKLCEDAGIKHHVDCSLVTPHMGIKNVDQGTWEEYREEHPEIVTMDAEEVGEDQEIMEG